jgi:hypothetical protein
MAPATSVVSNPGSGVRSGRTAVAWWIVSIAAVSIMCVARIAQEPRFFFWDDSQLGAFGQWYGLGSRLLDGQLPILSPGAWQGGNYLAEGQWGIWNPVTWIIALTMHAVDGATLAVTLIKVLFMLVLCTGTFLLARAYGSSPAWAALAGFTVTAGGQTIFMDAPSWVTGLQNIAVFAFVWWALKRHLDSGSSVIPYLIASYLLVTFGYVFGVIELALLLFVFLGFALAARDWGKVVRLLALGAFPALVAVVVYLPGILTAPVTRRSGLDILNDQFLNMDLGDLATSPITTAVSSVRGYWGDLLPVPLQYVTWLIPALILVGAGWRLSLRNLRVPLVLLLATVALVIGPSVIGPLRYPARMMPYVVLVVAVAVAVIATRGWPARVSGQRVLIAIAVTAACGWLAWAAQPASWRWVLVATVIQIALIGALHLRRLRLGNQPRAAAWLLIGSLVVLAPQIHWYPSSPLGNFNVPSSVSDMREVGEDMGDGIFTVGDVYSLQRTPAAYDESLLANLWYVTEKDAASVYTVLPFTTYAAHLCVDIRGWTCPDAYDALFDGPGQPLADDMALNTVVVVKYSGFESIDVPSGWTVEEGEFTWTLHRDDEVSRAGGVARTTTGVSLSDVSYSDTEVTFTVDDVPAGGGDVVLSRLAWPGYTSSGGEVTDPDRGFLLTVRVDEDEVGKAVSVQFRPPGWVLEVAAASGALVLAVGYSVWFAVAARRRTRGDVQSRETM